MNLIIDIDKSVLKEIESTYGNDRIITVERVVTDILERYLNVEYFDPDLNVESNGEEDNCETYLLSELKEIMQKIFVNNGYGDSLFDPVLLQKELFKDNFIVTEYEISRINTLAEVYFKFFAKVSPFSDLIELFVSYDIDRHYR